MCITNRREPLGGWASAGHLAMIPPLAIYDKAMKKASGACSLVIEFRTCDLFIFCFAPSLFQNPWLCLWSFDFCQVYMGAEKGMHRAAGVGVARFVFNLEHERDTLFHPRSSVSINNPPHSNSLRGILDLSFLTAEILRMERGMHELLWCFRWLVYRA